MTYSPSSIPTAEILLDTIAESFPGWQVILIAAPDLPQGGGHGAIQSKLCLMLYIVKITAEMGEKLSSH
jgi:hypothetical protein